MGAILTQNCSWRNVEKAIKNLKTNGLLEVHALYRMDIHTLAGLIVPCGFYNVKSKRLKSFINVMVEKYDGSFDKLSNHEITVVRKSLLAINGIGPETADSIILYALEKPIFVIDAYTRRFVLNHGLIEPGTEPSYAGLQRFFMDHLPKDTYLFNEYHALIVRLCQDYCKKTPRCEQCILKSQ